MHESEVLLCITGSLHRAAVWLQDAPSLGPVQGRALCLALDVTQETQDVASGQAACGTSSQE